VSEPEDPKPKRIDEPLFLEALRLLDVRARAHRESLDLIRDALAKQVPEDLASDFTYGVIDLERLLEELRKDPIWMGTL